MNRGIIYAVLAYVAWGLLPLYWKLFASLSSWEILGHRVLWSFVFVALLLLIGKRFRELMAVLRQKSTLFPVIWSSLLISANWLIFIWAVNNGHIVETSLGYYMNPIINVLLGVLFLKERLHPAQWLSIGLAFVGVLVLAVSYGAFPWISISLALSFGLYGLAKKRMKLDPMLSLGGETVVVLPLAVLYLSFIGVQGQTHVGALDAGRLILLLLSGAATAMPLFWFAQAAKRLTLSTVGFIQYIGPSISLVLGVLLFKEPFTPVHMVCFSLIWGALVLFTWSSFRGSRSVVRPIAREQ
ncbi:EamA family transporter RarD [Paenibacillus cremeus]|uniref:EamA family transporter RarD n=1 Tax=Paenibacillus cremeus TaxID=2163881 RepID=A0A559KEL0_9BACL|nr:EamA family transporter RarD [Paenibacillus cremeus]TVY10558.1 EamA family transporter RarD [Paenibacillus cremeus]